MVGNKNPLPTLRYIILMDIQMPVMSGLEAIEEISANTDTETILTIALTALAMSGDPERCLKAFM